MKEKLKKIFNSENIKGVSKKLLTKKSIIALVVVVAIGGAFGLGRLDRDRFNGRQDRGAKFVQGQQMPQQQQRQGQQVQGNRQAPSQNGQNVQGKQDGQSRQGKGQKQASVDGASGATVQQGSNGPARQ